VPTVNYLLFGAVLWTSVPNIHGETIPVISSNMDPVKLVEGYKFDDHTTSDLRVCFKLIDEQPEWFSCHSSVLSQNSKYFADWLAQNDVRSNNCIEIECPRVEYDHYVKMLKLMYLPRESVIDSFDSVKSAVGVLRASNLSDASWSPKVV